MKKILLTSAGVMAISAGMAYAACIPTPSCASLGYESSSSCEGGIKCPFGNAWNCTVINKVNEIEKIIQEGGTSGNKGDTSNCKIGSIFYSDWTCSSSLDSSKTPIAVVVYTSGEGHGQAMALENIGKYQWGGYGTDISTLTNFNSYEVAPTDVQSCSNTILITAVGDKNTYPAAWAAHEYKTEGTNAGDWCLPAAGIFTNIKKNMAVINAGFILTGGAQLEATSMIWSSTENNAQFAWDSYFNYDSNANYDYGLYLGGGYKNNNIEVRPVLEF